jgi:hypothetical protein
VAAAARAPGDKRGEERQRDRHFEVATEEKWRQHAAGQRAKRAAQRNQNVKFCEARRMWFRRRKLSMAKQADEE